MATLKRDGSPQLTPINYAYVDGKLLVSTTRERAKYHNVRRNPRVSLCIVRAEGRPYVSVSGSATVGDEDIADGTAAIFKRMYDRPLPDNFADVLKEQKRVLITITPDGFIP